MKTRNFKSYVVLYKHLFINVCNLNYYNTHIHTHCFMSDNKLHNVTNKTNFPHFKLNSRCSTSLDQGNQI